MMVNAFAFNLYQLYIIKNARIFSLYGSYRKITENEMKFKKNARDEHRITHYSPKIARQYK